MLHVFGWRDGGKEGSGEGWCHLHIKDAFNDGNSYRPFYLVLISVSIQQLTISSCSCFCRVELSFSCCLLYICMISTTIRSLSSSNPPTATGAAFVAGLMSLDAVSVSDDSIDAGRGRDAGGGGGVWEGMWVAFLQHELLVSMETAWAWLSRSAAEAAAAAATAALWDLASSAPAVTGGDAWRSEKGKKRRRMRTGGGQKKRNAEEVVERQEEVRVAWVCTGLVTPSQPHKTSHFFRGTKRSPTISVCVCPQTREKE